MARLLAAVLGHQRIIDRLLSAAEKNKLPHSLLFVGPPGVGKRTTAFGLAQSLLCEKSPLGCGMCGPCLRMAKGSSESVLLIAPEKKMIRTEEARRILDFLSLRSLGQRRVIIIDDAHLMNAQTSNSLLKILEEPPEGTHFLLIAPSTKHVLPTIRSRCQVVHFGSVRVEDMRKKSQAPDWVLKASHGSFEKVALLSEKEELEIRAEAVELLSRMRGDRWGYLAPEVKESFRDRSSAIRLGHHVALLLRDCVYWKLGEKSQVMNVDQEAFLQGFADLSEETLIETGVRALQIENALAANRDPSLVFEEFWLKSNLFQPAISKFS